MKKTIGFAISILALTGVALSGGAQAEFSGTYEIDVPVLSYSERYITVTEVRPVQECREVAVSVGGSTSSDTPELLGAVIGGAIGKEIDDDSKSSTVIGALLGASIASDLEKKNAQGKGGTRMETRCTTVERTVETQRLNGYFVNYEFQGHVFQATVPSRPGSVIKVKIVAIPVDYTN